MPILTVPHSPDINYVRTGPRGATPILFIHALGLDLSVWEPQLAALGEQHDLIAIDLPGHGLSGSLDAAPDFAAMAGIVMRFADALALGPVHLVGISVGGMIAQAVATRFPARIKSLTLLATSCTFAASVRTVLEERARTVRSNGMAGIIAQHLERWFPQDFRHRHPEVPDRFAKILSGQNAEFHARMWDMVAPLDLERQISTIPCPVLVVAGEDDPSATPAAGQMIADQVVRGRLVVFPNCGHFPQIEHAQAFNELLRGFVADVEEQAEM